MNLNLRTISTFLILVLYVVVQIHQCWGMTEETKLRHARSAFAHPSRPPNPSRTSPPQNSSPSTNHLSPSPEFPSSAPHAPDSEISSKPVTTRPAPYYGWEEPRQPPPPPEGWNKPEDLSPPKNTENQPPYHSNAWSIPGRQPVAPPTTPRAGWNPNVSTKVNNGQQRPTGVTVVDNADQANKKDAEQENSYPQGPPQSTQNFSIEQHYTKYQPGYQPGMYAYQSPTIDNFNPGYRQTTIIKNYQPPLGYYPVYEYTHEDTGDTTLGFYIGYSLRRLRTPNYHYYTHHNASYKPVYDHYEVHHYYHNNETAPKNVVVLHDDIVRCVGDSGNFCPPSTYTLCTSSGSIMCVGNITLTRPCKTDELTICVKSVLPCVTNTSEECEDEEKINKQAIPIDIPCLYTTKLIGNITFVNTTIVPIQPPKAPITTQNETELGSDNNTTDSNTTSSTSKAIQNNTSQTTTESPTTTTTTMSPLLEDKIEYPEFQFCVAIVAEPAMRKKLTHGEVVFNDAASLFKKMLSKVLGADRL